MAFAAGLSPVVDASPAACDHRAASGTARGTGSRREVPLVHSVFELYVWPMSSAHPLSISDARDQLASIINRVRAEHEPIYLSRRGRRVAAVIDADDLERLIELAEDMADIRAAEESREELRRTNSEPTPWEEVKADLGLT